ncbi:extracellular serine proteinase-like [Asterias rubens]|uniref:extracellular serine proteinase-like n=1 Tax=Asterias rubens TaxID=7604 RepID=UPI0014554BDF|nr:extracellular serine proteinase-like [Asterias rubens]
MKLLLLCLCVAVAQGSLAPLRMAKTRGIPGSYLVTVKDASLVDQVAKEIEDSFSNMRAPIGQMKRFRLALPAVSLRIPAHLVNLIRSIDGIKSIDQHMLGWTAAMVTQNHPTWGIDRIDSRTDGVNSQYTYDDTKIGAGVGIYFLDTGVQIGHNEFQGRAHVIYGKEDDQGHGTHCAGTAAGHGYGIARKANVFSARVCEPTGCATNDFIEGAEAIIKHANGNPGVVSISLVFPAWQGIDDATQSLLDRGLTVSVCAGNDNWDACQYSPQRVDGVFTVAASDHLDRRAVFSNYGSCVDIFAPGVDIISAGYSTASDHLVSSMSGTSMACPHVSGVAAQYIGVNRSMTNKQIKEKMLIDATPKVIRDSKSDNLFLYNGAV